MMISQGAILVAALICFILAAFKPSAKIAWGWVGMAILVAFVLLTKGKLI